MQFFFASQCTNALVQNMSTAVVLLLLAISVNCVTDRTFPALFPFGTNVGDSVVSVGDNSWSRRMNIATAQFMFYDTKRNTVYVSVWRYNSPTHRPTLFHVTVRHTYTNDSNFSRTKFTASTSHYVREWAGEVRRCHHATYVSKVNSDCTSFTSEQNCSVVPFGRQNYFQLTQIAFAVRLRSIRTVLLSRFCPSVCQTCVLWQNDST